MPNDLSFWIFKAKTGPRGLCQWPKFTEKVLDYDSNFQRSLEKNLTAVQLFNYPLKCSR